MVRAKSLNEIKLLVALLAITLSACTFNKMYYAPSPIPASAKKARLVDKETKDTTFIVFGENHQPSFTNSNGQIKEVDYIITSHNFISTSGGKIHAWMICPKSAKPKASILFLHGNAGNLVSHFPGLLPLVKKGFQIFIFDYSAYGFSTGKATRASLLKDAQSALNYFKSLPNVLNTKQIIYGQSLGGHLSAVLASQNQDKIDALVIEGAFSSHKDIAARTAGFIGRWMVKEKYSAKQSIKSFKKPVLIIHSKEDETIPFKMGKTLFENANEPKQFYEIKGAHMAGPVLYTDSISVKLERMIK